MNGRTAKASRHEIRKAFGPEAVSVLGAVAQASDVHDHNLSLLRDRVQALGQVTDALIARADSVEAWYRRPFWGRLRWLVRGT